MPPDSGRRRRRAALGVVAVAALSAVAGAAVGSQLKSPADAARERDAPAASRITVPVERRALSSSLTLSGDVQYAEPTPIKLGGAVGIDSGELQVVTRVPEIDQQVAEGDVVLDVSGRPVFVLQGDLPMYRALSLGNEGDDVAQLEAALLRLGFDPGPVDALFDGGTAAALDAFYSSIGYRSVGPSDDESDRLRDLRAAVTSAEETVRRAEADLVSAGERVTGAELLGLEQSTARARDAVPNAQTQSQRDNDAAAEGVRSATASRDSATVIRDAARTRLDVALAPNAVDPQTGEPYTAEEIATRRGELAQAEDNLTVASSALSAAQVEQITAAEQGTDNIRVAVDARELAEAQLAEALRPPDTSAAQQALDDARLAHDAARVEYEGVAGATGTRLPPGEVVFVSLLPSTVTQVTVAVGAPATDVLLTLSSAETHVLGRVARADSGLVQVGADVTIELRNFDLVFAGTVASIGQSQQSEEGGASSSGRLQVTVLPADPASLRDYVDAPVRILIDIASTDGDALVVPVAAVSVGGDGSSRVEVEREPITSEDQGSTEIVRVEVGLTAQGLVEITPIDDLLEEGDRVVVGAESSERLNEPDETDDSGADDSEAGG
jgi:peptidoglycan hydrolase-like protein with peptidoglycan-binding domain